MPALVLNDDNNDDEPDKRVRLSPRNDQAKAAEDLISKQVKYLGLVIEKDDE
jgi:hypothetical protein